MNDTIKAIGELWRLALCFAVPVTVYLLREPIGKCLAKITRIRRGETEIELGTENELPIAAPVETKRAAPPPEPDEKEKSEIAGGPTEDKPVGTRIVDALLDREDGKAKELLDSAIGTQPDKKAELEVFYYMALCHLRKDVSAAEKLASLKEHEEFAGQGHTILSTLGWFHRSTEQYSKANSYYQEAASRATNPADRASAIAGQAHCLRDLSEEEKALVLLTSAIREMAGDARPLAVLYRALAEMHEKADRKLEYALACEKLAEYEPTDLVAIFKAAYAQSHASLPFLSLHNYARELGLDETDSGGRNNYAVQLAELGLPIRAVQQYQRAREGGSTLAAANLAYLYLEQGFAEHAEDILDEARKTKDYHGNVDRALAQLRTKSDQEKERAEDLQRWGARYQRFARCLAEAFLLPAEAPMDAAGTWRTDAGEILKLTRQEDNSLCADWGKKWSRKKLTATQTNRSLKLEFYKETAGLYSDEPKYGSPREAFGWLSPDGQSLETMTIGKEDPLTLTLARVKSPEAEQEDGQGR